MPSAIYESMVPTAEEKMCNSMLLYSDSKKGIISRHNTKPTVWA